MRVLNRNKKTVWYANLIGTEPILDDNGLMTGQYEEKYTEPVKVRMSMAISSGANNLGSQGMADMEMYGIKTGYTHRMVTEDMKCPITEESLIWYGIDAGETADEVPHNFKVVRKAVSLNHIIYYIKEVDVDE